MKKLINFIGTKNSKISNKILKELLKNENLNVKFVSKQTDFSINRIEVSSGFGLFSDLQNEIKAIIPDLFPKNYFFKFQTNRTSSVEFLGYKVEFVISSEAAEEPILICYTKINEQRTDRNPISEKHVIKFY